MLVFIFIKSVIFYFDLKLNVEKIIDMHPFIHAVTLLCKSLVRGKNKRVDNSQQSSKFSKAELILDKQRASQQFIRADMSYNPYLGIKLIVRKCFKLKITTMYKKCTGYKSHYFEIIGDLINKSKHTTFPYHTSFEMHCNT